VIEKQTGGSKLLPVTEEIIASLGIKSVEDWKKALEDKNLAAGTSSHHDLAHLSCQKLQS
jgi:hypothetical protein